ncbi:hypothetical protein R3P38DRAFT_494418 [Favolaschia claudopus]|uniref:Uncharacterized protein n=1 Tax=Favolaschia claudopus TaxID=2862362 RepID=A0AAW0CLJ0_9AGAR
MFAVLAAGHPYPIYASNQSCTLHFVEYRAIGPPSTDFGHVGDVYIDLTPKRHALYWRDRGTGHWRRWTGVLLNQHIPLHQQLVSHPWVRSAEFSDLYLWADPGGVTWTSKDSICDSRTQMIQRNIATVVPGTAPNVEALVSELLHRMLDAERRTSGERHSESPPSSRSSSSSLPTSGRNVVQSFAQGSSSGVVRFPVVNDSSRVLTEQERYQAAELALQGMRRAQDAETRAKQELKQKTRELTRLRQNEKEVISMSYHYQKREQQLVAALAAAQQRSSGELQEMRAAVQSLQRHAESAQQDTLTAVQSSQEELSATQREIERLRSSLGRS